MSTIYYMEEDTQKGPVTLEELKHKSISRSTMVWMEGMKDWAPAETVADISKILPPSPPPNPARPPKPPVFKKEVKQNSIIETEPPKKQKGPSVKTMFMRLLAIVIGLFGIVLLITGIADLIVTDLIIGAVLLICAVIVFKRNKVKYKMTAGDKATHAGSAYGHFMNMDD